MRISKVWKYGVWVAALFIVYTCSPAGEGQGEEQAFSIEEPRIYNLMRTTLETVDGAEVMVSVVEMPPDTVLPRHYHPGEEFVYVLEGSATLWQQGKPDTVLAKGAAFKVPFEQEHTAITGSESARVLVFRVHRQGEPERILTEGD